jgi:methyl-accepting chemotaxis protein
MRRGATSTSRALAEQATGADQIAAATAALTSQIASVSQAMNEQATAVAQVSTSVNSMRRETDQASRALGEQSRGLKDMASATQNTAKHIKLITHANRDHSSTAAGLLEQLREVRQLIDRNAREVNQTLGGATDLVRHAEELSGLVAHAGRPAPGGHGNGANGRRRASNGRG